MKELESLIIEDQRRPNQWLRADADEPYGETGVPLVEVADGLEGSIMRGTMTDDASRLDLGAPMLGPNDVDQADERMDRGWTCAATSVRRSRSGDPRGARGDPDHDGEDESAEATGGVEHVGWPLCLAPWRREAVNLVGR